MEWEKIFVNPMSDRQLIHKLDKNSYNSNSNKLQIIELKKMIQGPK